MPGLNLMWGPKVLTGFHNKLITFQRSCVKNGKFEPMVLKKMSNDYIGVSKQIRPLLRLDLKQLKKCLADRCLQ